MVVPPSSYQKHTHNTRHEPVQDLDEPDLEPELSQTALREPRLGKFSLKLVAKKKKGHLILLSIYLSTFKDETGRVFFILLTYVV